jgi:twitching motility protein PilT
MTDNAGHGTSGDVDHVALLRALVERGASDLHCKAGSTPAIRVSGDLLRAPDDPVLGRPFTPESVTKLAQALLTTDQQEALLRDGSVVATHGAPGVGRFRVAVFRQRGSVAVVVHAVPQQVRALEELGLPPSVTTLASGERGLVLVASPVGNGATTTLAAMVDHVNRTRACHVVTVEDPAEVLHRDDRSIISQLEVPTDVSGLAEGVRSASRLDADVVTISDIADREVALASLDAVARGRLVLATIGGNTVRSVVDGFLELFTFEERPNVRQTLARSLAGVIVQRLLAGTDGRLLPVAEVLINTPKIQAVLAEEERMSELEALLADGVFHGMQTMDQSLRDQVRGGRIDEGTALAAATDPEELRIELLRS